MGGGFDEFNPRFVMEQNFVKEVIKILAQNEPLSYSVGDLEKTLGSKYIQSAVDLLKNVLAIREENGKLALNFSFFADKDCKIIKKIVEKNLKNNNSFLKAKVNEFGQFLKKLYPDIDEKILLYHLLCGKVFDGSIFDYLEERNLLKQSYPKRECRDFMIIGYENSTYCNKLNADLFCSFNHARYAQNSLSSFGNASGERFDYFRYFKLREKGGLYGKFLAVDKLLHDYSNQEIVSRSFEILQQIKESLPYSKNKFYCVLKMFGYIDGNDQIAVPVFDEYIEKCAKFSKFVFENVGDFIAGSITEIRDLVIKSKISCVKHGVDVDELCNELWHIYFGLLNKYLIDEKIVASPQQFYNQGKYLKCIYFSNSFK